MTLGDNMLICDLTQSWSDYGGGISTYLRQKRSYIEQYSDHSHLLIVPGDKDRITSQGRLILAEVAGPKVPQSPHYRFLLRNRAVKALLEQYKPNIVESLDPYNLPWAAISHRKAHSQTALVAGYRTDFPNAHIGRVTSDILGRAVGNAARHLSYCYAARLYRRFDAVYTLNQSMQNKLASLEVGPVDILPLGVDLDMFHPDRRDLTFRDGLGVPSDAPLLVYAGRIDVEKQVQTVLDAFHLLPEAMNAHLIFLGIGKSLQSLKEQTAEQNVHFFGYESDRQRLANILASSDIYVSAMPHETFGISIIEAQAAGLPVVGVSAGAMTDRVPTGTGLLGPVGDAAAMARNIQKIWWDDPVQFGGAGRALVQSRFSWQHSFETLFNTIYARAIAARRGPAGQEIAESQWVRKPV